MTEDQHVETQVFITLGGGVDLGINKQNHIVVIDRVGRRIDLGMATSNRFKDLQENLGRLSIYAVDARS